MHTTRKPRKRRTHHDDAGFSLIELLTIVVILAILAAIAIPLFLGQQAKAQDAAAQSNVATLGGVIRTGFGVGTAAPPAVVGSEIRWSDPAAGESSMSLGGATASITDSDAWCVTQVGGTDTWHMGPGDSRPVAGELPQGCPAPSGGDDNGDDGGDDNSGDPGDEGNDDPGDNGDNGDDGDGDNSESPAVSLAVVGFGDATLVASWGPQAGNDRDTMRATTDSGLSCTSQIRAGSCSITTGVEHRAYTVTLTRIPLDGGEPIVVSTQEVQPVADGAAEMIVSGLPNRGGMIIVEVTGTATDGSGSTLNGCHKRTTPAQGTIRCLMGGQDVEGGTIEVISPSRQGKTFDITATVHWISGSWAEIGEPVVLNTQWRMPTAMEHWGS